MGDQNVNNLKKKYIRNYVGGGRQKQIVNAGFQRRNKQANLFANRRKGQCIKVANYVISQHLSFYLPTDEITS